MDARLTKRHARCKASVVLTVLLTTTAAAEPRPPAHEEALRQCIASAQSAAAIAACEKRGQAALKGRIDEISTAIRARLDARQRPVFERNSEAWQAFVDSEIAMLGLSLAGRPDGLGPSLQTGAITLLYEARERQLREHLHNLTLARPPTP